VAPPPPVQPDAEFRGVFVTTAYNKDWPSRPGLHKDVQQNEMRAVIHRAKELNCNAVILQVRSFGDRIYEETKLEMGGQKIPWAMPLNFSNDPRYDPLEEWIEACHDEGMLLYAWVNPFRIDTDKGIGDLPFYAAADGDLYLDPTSKRVQAYCIKVITDLLDGYGPKPVNRMTGTGSGGQAPTGAATTPTDDDDGADGVIIDHYFPDGPNLKPAGPGVKEPSTRYKWLLNKHKMPRELDPADKGSVDDFIRDLYHTVKARDAKFGISTTMRQFEQKNSNVKLWLQQRWCDYFMPELYVAESETFRKSLKRWIDLNSPDLPVEKPQIVPVLYTSAVELPEMSGRLWDAQDILDQIEVTRDEKGSVVAGHAHFTARALRSPDHGGPPRPKHDVGDKVRGKRYQRPAPVPPVAAPGGALNDPQVDLPNDAAYVRVPGMRVAYFLVWRDYGDGNGWQGPEAIGKKGLVDYGPARIRVEAYDRHGRKSKAVDFDLR
jgi:hypothetical protein